MGQNLILNMNDHGFRVVAYNRTQSKTDQFINGPANGSLITGASSLNELVSKLSSPRKIMLMVKAGEPVDSTINSLVPLLEPGDVIIDGGNSNFNDSQRRAKELAEIGLLFVGCGVSGGEEGARHGPSMMPGGHKAAWPLVKPIFQAIAAKTEAGEACCDWVGDDGAGHFVKMVHNGIEYGDMQLICESYHFMKRILGMDNDSMRAVFARWNEGNLKSYLIEITADILGYSENGQFVVDDILDKAGQKGTGKWTVITSLELGMPLTLIGEAVFARCLSAQKDLRVQASNVFTGPTNPSLPAGEWTDALGDALLASKIVSYAQGYMLMKAAAEHYGWSLNYGGIAAIWRGGCIIRSVFLNDIKSAYEKNPGLENLLLDEFFRECVENANENWRKVLTAGITHGVPMASMTSALGFFDNFRTASMPHNLLQAQRDYFGAHTYQKVDGGADWYHTDWTGSGGVVSSTSYNR